MSLSSQRPTRRGQYMSSFVAERQAREFTGVRLWYDVTGDRTHDRPHTKQCALPFSYVEFFGLVWQKAFVLYKCTIPTT